MSAPPVRTELVDTYPNPNNATFRAGIGKLYDYVTGLLGATGNAAEARAALGVMSTADTSLVVNSGFTINQDGYVSGAALAAGSYGHDQWKAGAGGGDYTFTQLNCDTQITIAANKTLIQVIEDKRVHSTIYTLSWEGTALARYAVNSATPSGAYAASPIVITGQTAGSVLSVEFGNGASAGTLGKVMLSEGGAALSRKARDVAAELNLCQWYYWRHNVSNGGLTYATQGHAVTASLAFYLIPVAMRATPTFLMSPAYSAGWKTNDSIVNDPLSGTPTVNERINNAIAIQVASGGALAASMPTKFYNNTGSNGYIALSARI